MMNRRRLLEMDTGYIKSGLVLWLDGLNRGNTPGVWQELINNNNVSLQNTYTELSNGILFPNQSPYGYGVFTDYLNISRTTGTIEIAVKLLSKDGTGRPTYCEGNNTIGGSIALNNDGGIAMRWWNRNGSGDCYVLDINDSFYITGSANELNGLLNGQIPRRGTISSWSTGGHLPYLASRGTGNPFIGEFYALRIYNRHLSVNEMLHNQKIDNKRYNLGLNI